MKPLSLGQAAKLAGKGKTTIARAIDSGRLSAKRLDGGGYAIDPAELARVYELRFDNETGEPVPATGPVERAATPAQDGAGDGDARARIALLEEKVSGLSSTLEAERRRADAAEADRDRWAKQAETVAGLLPPPDAATKKAGILDRLLGKKGAA